MSDIFRIHVFPAQRGDALWVEYGPSNKPFTILIDGGITRTGREHLIDHIAALGDEPHIDLLVVTHIDLDHIQGIITLLNELGKPVTIDSVWFNGWDQLPIALEEQGIKEGIALSDILSEHFSDAWNRETGGQRIGVNDDGSLQVLELPGGMMATILSPDRGKLERLRDEWEDVIEAFGAAEEAEQRGEDVPDADEIDGLEIMGVLDVDLLADFPFKEDKTPPNGSSIACLLEFKGKYALLLGDAHPGLVLQSLKKLSPNAPFEADCVKVSHHGSKANTSTELVAHLRSPRWIFSSNGAMTKHPNPETVARILKHSGGRKHFVFNYATGFNNLWDDDDLRAEHKYTTEYGDGTGPVIVTLL
jgi:beta-lactamase superfamily II metal-dependent hydrolase